MPLVWDIDFFNDAKDYIMNKVKTLLNYKFYLMLIFGFERWHLVKFRDREYAMFLVKALNMLENKSSVLEVGCGLGDILLRLKFSNKTGIDISKNVIQAAKFLSLFKNFNKSKFRYVCQDIRSRKIDGKYNVIILVNWIHNIDSKELKDIFKNLYHQNLMTGGTLVFDIVTSNDYKYQHNLQYLIEGLNMNYNIHGPFEYGRYLVMCQK